MTTRRCLLAGSALLMLLRPRLAAAADLAAQMFVERIYTRYTGRRGAEGVPLNDPGSVRQLFDMPLAALIMSDQTRSAGRNEPPAMDADPFVDAQDWVIRDLKIFVMALDAQHATATVSFSNFDKPTIIRLDLLRLASGWHIHEIIYSHITLTQILNAPD